MWTIECETGSRNLGKWDSEGPRSTQCNKLTYVHFVTASRPNLAFSVYQCAEFMSNPGMDHFKALDRI